MSAAITPWHSGIRLNRATLVPVVIQREPARPARDVRRVIRLLEHVRERVGLDRLQRRAGRAQHPHHVDDRRLDHRRLIERVEDQRVAEDARSSGCSWVPLCR